MSSSLQQLEAIVERSGCEEMEPGERFSIDVIHADINNSMVKFVIHPRRYFYY
jgi:hypothetical protein